MTRWDVRAHMSDSILRALNLVHFPEQAAARGGRLTVVFYVQDNVEVMSDIDRIAESLGANADFLIVKNRFKSKATKMFDGSQLEKDLRALGAGEIEMPVLLNAGKNPLAKLGLTLGRNFTIAEAIKNTDLPMDFTARLVLEDWLKTMYRGYDKNAHLLLPSAEAAGIAPPESNIQSVGVRRSINRINTSNL